MNILDILDILDILEQEAGESKLASETGELTEEYERCRCWGEETDVTWERDSQFWTKEQIKITAKSLEKRRREEGAKLMEELAVGRKG